MLRCSKTFDGVAGGRFVPDYAFGVPLYLALTILFFGAVILIGPSVAARLGTAPRAGTGGLGGKLQMISAVFGILSFAMQVLQWLHII